MGLGPADRLCHRASPLSLRLETWWADPVAGRVGTHGRAGSADPGTPARAIGRRRVGQWRRPTRPAGPPALPPFPSPGASANVHCRNFPAPRPFHRWARRWPSRPRGPGLASCQVDMPRPHFAFILNHCAAFRAAPSMTASAFAETARAVPGRLSRALCAAGSFALAGLLAACSGGQAAPSAKPATPPPEVGFVTVTTRVQDVRTELPGRTRAAQSAEVRPQVGGIIQKRLFTEGSWVKAGQLLYTIDAPNNQATVRSAEAALVKARTIARSTRVTADRHATLMQANAVSRQVYEDTEAQAAQAAAEVAVAEATLANARINLQYSRVVAPISGLIDLSNVSVGALVSANQAQALTTISQLDPVHVDITQSSTDLLELKRKLQAGEFGKVDAGSARVRLVLEDGSEYPHEGRLQFTGAT
ncbi:MAG: efflux RND transporter periplasmic adaptor subunit, partial [Comamonadaceae bacterium]